MDQTVNPDVCSRCRVLRAATPFLRPDFDRDDPSWGALYVTDENDEDWYEEGERPIVFVDYWYWYAEFDDLGSMERHEEQFFRLLDDGRGYANLKQLESAVRGKLSANRVALTDALKQLYEKRRLIVKGSIANGSLAFVDHGAMDTDDLVSSLAETALCWESKGADSRLDFLRRINVEADSNAIEEFNQWLRAAAYFSAYAEMLARYSALSAVIHHFEAFGVTTNAELLCVFDGNIKYASSPAPSMRGRGVDYLQAALAIRGKPFKNYSDYFRAIAERALKPDGTKPTLQAVWLWFKSNGYMEDGGNLDDFRERLEQAAQRECNPVPSED